MKLPTTERRRQREPIGPLVDIVFLLLVFFLLAGTLEPAQPIEVDPPESGQAASMAAGPMRVLLAADGRIGFEGRVLDVQALAAAIGARSSPDMLRSVQVEADGDAAAGLVLALLKQLRSLGFRELALVTRSRSAAAQGDG